MIDFITKLLHLLASRPEEISLSERQDGAFSSYEIKVAPEDIGRVIGKNGNTIRAIRSLTRLKAIKENRQVAIHLLDSNQEA